MSKTDYNPTHTGILTSDVDTNDLKFSKTELIKDSRFTLIAPSNITILLTVTAIILKRQFIASNLAYKMFSNVPGQFLAFFFMYSRF